jgi:hypothetical protein
MPPTPMPPGADAADDAADGQTPMPPTGQRRCRRRANADAADGPTPMPPTANADRSQRMA